ncbi:MAG: Protein of unknown function (DUF1553)/Protein of unknown function [Planctomycetaceae bacterium]|nr:Protein of unknown function (DUF1553)/Protein of unknown function [Planctomycetaceae bacterium]
MLGRRRFLLALLVIFTARASVSMGAPLDPAESGSAVGGAVRTAPIEFTRDVLPALTKAGCNSGACHGSFQGRGGFQLSLLGFDAAFDYDVLTKASRGRRLNAGIPERSLLLLKPTGAMPHGGGRRIAPDSEVAAIIKTWISQGMAGPRPDDLRGLSLKVEPSELTIRVKAEGAAAEPTVLKVVASFADGSSRDVTKWASYDIREKLTAEVSRLGTVTAHRPGKTAVQVKYLGQVAAVSVSVPYAAPSSFEFPVQNFIDELAVVEWKRLGAKPAPLADDATFLRRVYLDLIGTLPTPAEVRKFLADTSATKRSQVIDELLARPEYVDFWSLRMADLLRAHRRYLGDKGLASFSGWIRQSVRENKPLDQLTRELLTSQGNLFTNGPVGYYFIDEKVEDLAETTSQVFLGVRLQCTRCHHHPNEVWSQEDYYGLAAFFTRLETKDSGTQGSKFGGPKSLRPSAKENPNRKPLLTVAPRLFGEPVLPADATSADPRQKLAEWITKPDNPFFARNFTNRYWQALLGRGLVEPVDDMRATNPAAFPALLDALAKDFAAHHFDAKYLLRTICNSRVYQLAPELNPQQDVDGLLFTHRIPKRLSAEVLLDGINQLTGSSEVFEGQPVGTRAIALPDPTIVSHFLSTFGRPLRNSPCDCARGASLDLSQALHLANSTALHEKVVSSTGRLATSLKAGQTDDQIVEELYLGALGRLPADIERQAVRESLAEGTSRDETWQDVLWALINCSEFVFNH